jgi:putative ABC transport system substrate-binding protein
MLDVRRRKFITLIGGAAAWPLVARAQQRRAPTVGILNYAAAHDLRVIQFLNALRDLGYVEGRNLAVSQRHADGALDRLPQLAAELVAAQVDLIIALGPAVWAANDHDDSNRHRIQWQSGEAGRGRKPRAPWRKHHRFFVHVGGFGRKAA